MNESGRRSERSRALLFGALMWIVILPTPSADAACPPSADQAVDAGWRAYRAGRWAEARASFERAQAACPGRRDVASGLGYAALREGEIARAESLFRAVVSEDSLDGDAWGGLTYVAVRQGRPRDALESGLRAARLQPSNHEIAEVLDGLLPGWERPRPARIPSRLARPEVVARTQGDRFEVRAPAGWSPFYVKGMNLGVALPGCFPSEFPQDSARYAGWIDRIASMHANALRVYTIFPPAFYRALAGWNRAHTERALWLIHGVWTELPPEHHFDDRAWLARFHEEMQCVVDVVHGAVDVPIRPGHAGGRYDADVSPWTLAFILGREWEPFAVEAFDAGHPGDASYRGRWLAIDHGTATEVWMAQQCDDMLGDEHDRYGALRPIAFTNWPTLDPLHHPTEASRVEEREWRRRRGATVHTTRHEYDNDAQSLDANRIHPTPENPAGWFASYHAYPYYPDFMVLDPAYARARSTLGPSSYFGYLTALKRHHVGMPVLIAEYGVPSSRGMAHFQPQGWNHGGLDERAMAETDAAMTREIRESGMAGGVLFAWIDEWFKKNWTVIDLELPEERTRLWHNALDPEQNYGVIAMDAGSENRPRLGGDPQRWRDLPALATASGERRALRALRVGGDASYLYLALERPRVGSGFDSLTYRVAIDTRRADLGQHTLPAGLVTGEIGFEFLVDLEHPDRATLRVTPGYNPYAGTEAWKHDDDRGHFYQPILETARRDGRFDSLFIVTNRARFGRDGTFFAARGYDRGRLRFGTEDQSSLADWYADSTAGLIEIRLPWGLLGVTDPSSRTVLAERSPAGSFATATSEGFRIGAVACDPSPRPRVIESLPDRDANGRWEQSAFALWRWAGWEQPVFDAREKPAYRAMQSVWGEWPDGVLSQRDEP